MVFLNLDRSGRVPLFKQIQTQLVDLIEKNVLPPGSRLPSTRSFAEKLGVHRSTVYKAYEELWALGYLQSSPGSYSFVREKQQCVTPEQISEKSAINWQESVSSAANKIYHSFMDARFRWMEPSQSVINFGSLDLDMRLFPIDHFRKCMNRVFIEKGAELLKYGECEGYMPLREYISKRLRIHNIAISADEILITNGAQDGFDLIMKLFAEPGRRVVVESPTYAMILPILTYYRAEVVGVPMDDTGIRLSRVEKEFKKDKPAFLYTIPNFHNPTGITTSQQHREQLLRLCERYGVPLVEDAFEEEMKYFGKVPLPIKSMDRQQIVIYLGTFSKVLFPGVRVGWIAANKECIERLAALKRFSDLASGTPVQAALAEFCNTGGYHYHITKMHRIYRKRMQIAVDSLKSAIVQPDVSWIEPNGGYLIWLGLNNVQIEENDLNTIFLANGIRVAFGNVFFPDGKDQKYLRLSISTLNEEEIKEGIFRLGKALSSIYQGFYA